MVGADPNNCSGSDCDVTVTVDIIPLNVIVGEESFNGSDVVNAVLASPVFTLNDYGSTPFATAAGNFPNQPRVHPGSGRSPLAERCRKSTPARGRHHARAIQSRRVRALTIIRLNPVVHDAIEIVVPNGRGTVLQIGRGVHFGRH